MKPEYLADPEGRGACGVKGHDSGSASAALADWEGTTSLCVLCVPLSCSALPCPCSAAEPPHQITSHGCPLAPALPASSAASLLIPCPSPAAEVLDAERDPWSQQPQPGHDGALPQITGIPHSSPCVIPCSAAALMLPAALTPAQPLLPTSCPHHGSPRAPAWAGSVSHHLGQEPSENLRPRRAACPWLLHHSLGPGQGSLQGWAVPGWHTPSVSAASQLPSLPAGRAGQSTSQHALLLLASAFFPHAPPASRATGKCAGIMDGQEQPPSPHCILVLTLLCL